MWVNLLLGALGPLKEQQVLLVTLPTPEPCAHFLFPEMWLWIWLEENEFGGSLLFFLGLYESHKINPIICHNCFSLLRRTQTPRSPFSSVFFSGSHSLLVESQQPQTWDHSQTRETQAILGKTMGGCFGDGAHRLPWQPSWLSNYYFKCWQGVSLGH